MAKNAPEFDSERFPDQHLSGLIIASAYEVHRSFGYGFLESVYRRALVEELRFRGASVQEEVTYDLTHRGVAVGSYRADIVVESRVIVEVKTGLLPDPVAQVQLLNYLSAAHLELGLVLSFCPGLHVKRLIRSEAAKKHPTQLQRPSA